MVGTYPFVLALAVALDHMGLFPVFHVGSTAVIGFFPARRPLVIGTSELIERRPTANLSIDASVRRSVSLGPLELPKRSRCGEGP